MAASAMSPFEEYGEGQILTLSILPESTLRVRIRKLHSHTLSTTMVVDILEEGEDPEKVARTAFLKLFDRRFAADLREEWHIEPWSKSDEEAYIESVENGAMDEFLHKLHHVENYVSETEDDWDDAECEIFLADKSLQLYEAEVGTYKALMLHQGRHIPRLLAPVELDLTPAKSCKKSGDGEANCAETPDTRVTGEEATVDKTAIGESTIEETAGKGTTDKEATSNTTTAEDACVEETAIEKPLIKEPLIKEPLIKELFTKEPLIEEPSINEATIEGTTIEELAVEDTTCEEMTAEEPTSKKAIKEAEQVSGEKSTLIIKEVGNEQAFQPFKVKGVLLEYIEGYNMWDMLDHFPPSTWQGLVDEAIGIVHILSDYSILNQDVRPENFLVAPGKDGAAPRVYMIDFGCCRFRREDESDEDWGRDKNSRNEDGAIGARVQQKAKRDYGVELVYEVSERFAQWGEGEFDEAEEGTEKAPTIVVMPDGSFVYRSK